MSSPALRALQAARNNAVWCDVVCQTHALAREWHADVWLVHQEPPRFYPDAVTLAASEGSTAQIAAVSALVEAAPQRAVSVKDSFATLDLAPLGFAQLFEATWLWRDAAAPLFAPPSAGTQWSVVRSAAELARWEQAWNGPPEENAQLSRIFLPALLADSAIRVLVAYRGERIVGGCIANRSDDVVGVSNVFAPAGEARSIWAGAVPAVAAAFPGMPLVGYERGDDLVDAESVGFERVGPLRVWLREA